MGKNDFPNHFMPMLASTGKRPFNDPEWQYEVKWDGYRMLAYVQKGKVELRSRNNNDYTKPFRIIADEMGKWKLTRIIN